MRVLATLGDSWPCGAELSKPNEVPYGEILKETLGYDKLVKICRGGASNEEMVLQLLQVPEQINPSDQVTVVFYLTNPARSMYWPDSMSWNWQSKERQHWPSDAKDTIKELFLHFHDNDMLRNSLCISGLQSMCKFFGYQDYYFAGWVRYTEWLPCVDTSKIWKQGNETAADWFEATNHNGEHLLDVENNKYIRPNFAHPNQLGHKLIAQKLANWIKQ